MKKILIWECLDIIAGGQRVGLNVADALKDIFSCSFIAPQEGPLTNALIEKEISYKILSVGKYNDSKKTIKDIFILFLHLPFSLFKAYRIIKINGIDLIYANMARAFIAATLIGSFRSIPVVWHVHNCFNDKKTITLLNFLGKLKSVKKIIFVSNKVRDQFPDLKFKSEVIYNSVNIKEFKSDRVDLYQLKNRFGIPDNKKIISTIGLIIPEKGQSVLIKAIPLVLNKVPNVHFLFIGRPVENKHYEKIIADTETMKIDTHITFTGHRTDMPHLFKIIDINTINSIVAFEACPLVIFEGCASGVPTIGSNIGGTTELIKQMETGLLYKVGDEQELAAAIIKLLKDDALYRTMSSACVKNSMSFDTSKFDHKIINTISDVLGE